MDLAITLQFGFSRNLPIHSGSVSKQKTVADPYTEISGGGKQLQIFLNLVLGSDTLVRNKQGGSHTRDTRFLRGKSLREKPRAPTDDLHYMEVFTRTHR